MSRTSYRRRQPGTVTIVCLLIGVGIVGLAALDPAAHGGSPIILIAAGVLLGGLALACFGSLTLEVDDGEVRFELGVGLIRKSYPLEAIEAVRSVRHPWYYGWGIRYTGEAWLWRVSGLDSIELTLKRGGKVCIGTDDPDGAVAAIQARLGMARRAAPSA